MKYSIYKRTWLGLSVTFLFVVDRLLRWYALYRLPAAGRFVGDSQTGMILDQNAGLLYGVTIPQVWLLILLGLIVIGIVTSLMLTMKKNHHQFFFPLGLMLVGVFSNLLDRLQQGYVVDMLTITGQPIFNLADLMIVSGAAWVLLLAIQTKRA